MPSRWEMNQEDEGQFTGGTVVLERIRVHRTGGSDPQLQAVIRVESDVGESSDPELPADAAAAASALQSVVDGAGVLPSVVISVAVLTNCIAVLGRVQA